MFQCIETVKQIGRCLIRYADNRVYDLGLSICRLSCDSETCINRSCSKAETLLGRTGTFDPVCFLYASLSHISKAEIVKRTLLQTDNLFQSSDKKFTCYTRTQIKVLGIFKKQRINLDIFVNFLPFKTVFFYFILQFLKEILLSIIAHIKYRFKQFL